MSHKSSCLQIADGLIEKAIPSLHNSEKTVRNGLRAHGQLEPIWLSPDGRIVDGRNRYNACRELGIAPMYQTWSGNGSLVAFVLAKNFHRRNLTASQRAAIAVTFKGELETEIKEEHRAKSSTGGRGNKKGLVKIDQPFSESPGRDSRAEAAKLANVSEGYGADAEDTSWHRHE